MTGLAQTFADTHSGTIGKGSVASGWTKISSPEYSSTTVNAYSPTDTYWTNTLPVTPSGSTTFPVTRAGGLSEGIKQTITGLTPGTVYEIEVSYMYPTATGTFGRLFTGSPPTEQAYVAIGGAKTYLPIGNANVWFTRTVKFTPTTSSITLELRMDAGTNEYATAFDVVPNAVKLPVDLLRFETRPTDNHTAKLSWTTASEINNSLLMWSVATMVERLSQLAKW